VLKVEDDRPSHTRACTSMSLTVLTVSPCGRKSTLNSTISVSGSAILSRLVQRGEEKKEKKKKKKKEQVIIQLYAGFGSILTTRQPAQRSSSCCNTQQRTTTWLIITLEALFLSARV